jgi:hypothetical protein
MPLVIILVTCILLIFTMVDVNVFYAKHVALFNLIEMFNHSTALTALNLGKNDVVWCHLAHIMQRQLIYKGQESRGEIF